MYVKSVAFHSGVKGQMSNDPWGRSDNDHSFEPGVLSQGNI